MDKNKQFKHVLNFINVMKNKRTGISNIYIFESTDKNGNVTDIKYGMNLMTNNGFNTIYKTGASFALKNASGSDPGVHLYLGSGVSNFDKSSSYIETQLFGGLPATNSNINKDYEYPIIFSRGQQTNTGIITFVSRFGVVYYDYNITNYDVDTLVTEYGIGTSPTSLWTHSHIYDDNGNKSQVTKKANERLTIYVYMCMSLYEHVIMNGFSNDVHMMITSNQIMYQKMQESNLYTYKKGNVLYDRTSGSQHTYNDVLTEDDIRAGIDSIIRNTTTMEQFTLWSQKGSNNGYIDGFVYKAPGFIMFNPEYLPEPEQFEVTNFTSENILKPSGFADKIGKNITDDSFNKNTWPTFTTMNNVNVYTYNYHSGVFNNPCAFTNNDNKQLTNVGLEKSYCLPLYYWSNDAIQTAYVFENPDVTNDILSINQGHVMMFACDKYWDQSTWINITDFNNIPNNAKNARYWIAGSNSLDIIPTRLSRSFELLDHAGGTNGYQTYTQNAFELNREGAKPSVDIPQYNCMVVGGHICALRRNLGYTFAPETTDALSYNVQNFTYDKWLLSFRDEINVINVIDVSGLNATNPDTSVLNVTRTLEFTTSVKTYSETYRTESGNGLICVQSLTSTNECILLSVGNTITSTIHQWAMSCCIYGTNLVAYIPSNDTSHIHIYDTTLSADVGNNISLPTGYTPTIMFGNDSHLWFWDGTTTYYVNISATTRVLQTCNNIDIIPNPCNAAFSYVDDVTMVYDSHSTTYALTNACYISHTTPTVIHDMSAFYGSENMSGSVVFMKCDLRYINSDSLICVITFGTSLGYSSKNRGTSIHICDLGQYINRSVVYQYFNQWSNPSENGRCGCYFYGESIFYDGLYVFPVVNALELRLTGDTRTITSFNHTKNISGKTFEIGFTNIPLWGYEVNNSGKPPGSPSPTLNGNGEIIGWS